MWGVIPAAGLGSRIQPLAFSKELLPVGSRRDGEVERPRAVSEYLIDRMLLAGVTRLCIVISPGKSDIIEYYGAEVGGASVCYVVQPRADGLCDAVFRAMPLIRPEEHVVVGLPDTIWFPEQGLCALGDDDLSFLLFPVDQPELFDVITYDSFFLDLFGEEPLEEDVCRVVVFLQRRSDEVVDCCSDLPFVRE